MNAKMDYFPFSQDGKNGEILNGGCIILITEVTKGLNMCKWPIFPCAIISPIFVIALYSHSLNKSQREMIP